MTIKVEGNSVVGLTRGDAASFSFSAFPRARHPAGGRRQEGWERKKKKRTGEKDSHCLSFWAAQEL